MILNSGALRLARQNRELKRLLATAMHYMSEGAQPLDTNSLMDSLLNGYDGEGTRRINLSEQEEAIENHLKELDK